MPKHNCAICGAEIGVIAAQKLGDGNYICRKNCRSKLFKVFDCVPATLPEVTDHIAQIEYGTKVWNQIFVPLKKTKNKEEKLRQIHGIQECLVYVSPSTGLIAFNENRYKFMFFGKTEYACVYRVADLVTYEYESETKKNSEGKDETKHYCWFGFQNTAGLSYFRVGLSSQNDYNSLEKYFNELFGIQKTVRNSFNNARRQVNAIKAAAGAIKAIKDGTIDEEQAAATMDSIDAMVMGDRTEWIAKADAALARIQ
ncbi:MAG: DUF4428 domain-containing protein [Clostridia bacterium]|nr:DUF4428 domain-containing protein [Clostridia bacterium]